MSKTKPQTAYRGMKTLAATDPEAQREIARKGGKKAHELGTGHEFSSEEARAAGKLTWEKHPKSSAYMSRIGKLGVEARRKKTKEANNG